MTSIELSWLKNTPLIVNPHHNYEQSSKNNTRTKSDIVQPRSASQQELPRFMPLNILLGEFSNHSASTYVPRLGANLKREARVNEVLLIEGNFANSYLIYMHHEASYKHSSPPPSADVENRWGSWRTMVMSIVVNSQKPIEPSVVEEVRDEVAVVSKGTRERIEALQKILGLTVARLAEMLNVHRATIYSWIEQDVKLQISHQQALESLELRAEQWAIVCRHPPGTLLRNREVNGQTLEAWLTDPNATHEQLEQVMNDIARRVELRERKISGGTTQTNHSVSSELRSFD